MVLCCGKAKDDDLADAKSTGAFVPKSKRKCRDVLCCLLFLVYWVGMVIIAILAVKTGQPLRLVYGRDYAGNVCGGGALADTTFTAYPRLDEDLLAGLSAGLSATDIKFFGVCVTSCPTAGASVCTYDNATCWVSPQDTTPVLFRCLPIESSNETVIDEECLDPVGADPECTTEIFMNGGCAEVCHAKRVKKEVWEVAATTTNPLVEQLQGYAQVLGRFFGDMTAAKWLVLAVGGLGALVLGVIWLLLLQFFAGCMVWITCALVLVVLLVMSLFCSVRGGLISSSQLSSLSFLDTTNTTASITTSLTGMSSSSTTSTLQFKVAGYLLWALTIIVFLLLVAMRKRIKIAVAVIRESSRAIRAMPLLLLWPIIPSIFFLALVVYSIAIAACLLSSDDLMGAAVSTLSSIDELEVPTDLNATQAVPQKTAQQALLAFHIFGFLWTNQLLQAISVCAIAGSVAQFYWTVPDGNGRRKMDTRFPVARAVFHTLRFSLGSLCFGSFVIAFVQFLRLVLEYIDHNTRELQKGNRVVKVAFMVIKCCLWCFEKCLKFLSKNAYIVIAMKGSSFCSASVASFKLLLTNLARVAVVNSISFFLLLLAKLTITLAVGVAVFAALAKSEELSDTLAILDGQPVTSPMAPVLAASVLAWLVSSAFMNVYDTAIDTILLCFCEDSHLTGGAASEFMSEELRRIMGGATTSGTKTTVIHVSPSGRATPKADANNDTDI